MKWTAGASILLVLASGCSRQPAEQANVETRTPAPARLPPPAPAPPRERPAIDPKSTAAAELLVGAFVNLVNQRRFADAYMLLGPNAGPRSQFDSDFARYSDLKVAARTPGGQEGAAGSIYLSIPLDVSGRVNGRDVSRSATAVLRRVNDVPGSTEAQRHWHIERIDWGNG
jgi:hypothetical protein